MNSQDIPARDEQRPVIVANDEDGSMQGEERQPVEPLAARLDKPYPRPDTPSPSRSREVPPWTGYTPNAIPPWNWQPATYSPYPSYPPRPRKTSRWPWIILTVVILFLLVGGGIGVLLGGLGFTGYTNRTTETRAFTVDTYPKLILTSDTGSIHVSAAPAGNVITLQATKQGTLGANLDDIRVTYAQNTESHTVTVNVERLTTTPLSSMLSVDFDVTVPPTAVLQLKTNTGSIAVNGVSGQMVLTSNIGSIQVSGATVRGDTVLITNTGSITFNGAIEQRGTYTFTTNTGSVNVTLPPESVFHVDAYSITGSINTNFPGIIVAHGQGVGSEAHSDTGNSPQATINVRTSTGSINLNQS